MASGYCPKCRRPTNLELTVSRRTVADADGRERTLVTRTYHCEACGTFVRSEEAEENALGEGGPQEP